MTTIRSSMGNRSVDDQHGQRFTEQSSMGNQTTNVESGLDLDLGDAIHHPLGGASSIKIDPMGVTISAPMVTSISAGSDPIQGPDDQVNGDAMLHAGGITMIN